MGLVTTALVGELTAVQVGRLPTDLAELAMLDLGGLAPLGRAAMGRHAQVFVNSLRVTAK